MLNHLKSYKELRRIKKAAATKKDKATTSSQPVPILDPTKQLENIYTQLCRDDGGDPQWKKEVFQSVRILVLGRSGSGKTTLIRLIVGDDGPEEVTKGTAGVQDISKEYVLYPASGNSFRLIIHDSNGADVKGKERLDTIKDFFKEHQKSSDFSQHVHLVWYVVSSVDSRCLDDADIMKAVGETGIPLLLIMTFNDFVKDTSPEDRIVTEDIVDKLLDGVKDKENVKKNMVRVGNAGVRMDQKRGLIINKSKNDHEALMLVSQRTQKLMARKLRYAWAVFQAVDMDAKVDASAALIDSYGRRAFFTSLPRLIPLADPLRLAVIFYRAFYCLCEIWMVPVHLKNALKKTILYREGIGSHILGNICKDVLFVGSLGASIAATVLTGGIALPSVIVVLATSGFLNAKTVPILVKTFALQVLVCILYVKCTQPSALNNQKWDANVEEEEYIKHCETFSHNNRYDKILKDFASVQHSTVSTVLRHKKVRGLIKSKIVELFNDLHLKRKDSLYTQLLQDDNSASSSSCSRSTFTTPIMELLDNDQEEDNHDNGYDFGSSGDEGHYE